MHYLIWCYGKKSHKKDLTHLHKRECIHFPVLVKFLAPYVCLCSAMLFHDTQLQIYKANQNLTTKTLVNFKIWKHYFVCLLLTLCGCTMVTSNFSILIISSSACTIASLIFQYSSPSSRGADPLWRVLWVTLMTSLIFSGSSFTLPAR